VGRLLCLNGPSTRCCSSTRCCQTAIRSTAWSPRRGICQLRWAAGSCSRARPRRSTCRWWRQRGRRSRPLAVGCQIRLVIGSFSSPLFGSPYRNIGHPVRTNLLGSGSVVRTAENSFFKQDWVESMPCSWSRSPCLLLPAHSAYVCWQRPATINRLVSHPLTR
jgi:hypothetical protein